MLTGDKGETAETIGISCGLIDTDEQTIYTLKSSAKNILLKDLKSINSNIEKLKSAQFSQSDLNQVSIDKMNEADGNMSTNLKLSRQFSSSKKVV
jgi:magnesium-transporting ATPase (P-type)